MKLIGRILLAIVGLLMAAISVVSVKVSNYSIEAAQVTLFLSSVGCLLLATFDVSKISFGAGGLSAEMKRHAKAIETLRSAIVADASPAKKYIIDTLFWGDGWVDPVTNEASKALIKKLRGE